MPSMFIQPGSADSGYIGAMRSADAVYATALAGTGTFTSFSSTSTIPGGQRLTTGVYDLNQQYFGFTPSSAISNAVVTRVVFGWTTNSANVTGADAQSILAYDTGGAITSADWRTAAQLGALTSYGTIPATGYQSNSTTYSFDLNAAAITAAQTALRAGTVFTFMMCASAQVSSTAPVGNDRYDLLSEQDATAGNRPSLTIYYYQLPVMTDYYLRQMGV